MDIYKDVPAYFHPAYVPKTGEFDRALPCQEELIASLKEYTAKLKRPDLLGKTVRVTRRQFPQLHACVQEMAEAAGIGVPEIYLYEDFYYGAEAKGKRIELSAKTLADFPESWMRFLLAREICRLRWGMVRRAQAAEQALSLMEGSNLVKGLDILEQDLTIVYGSWSRTAHYTADAYGYCAVQDIKACVQTVLALVLNNIRLVKDLNVREYLRQAEEIYLLDDVVSRYSENDEKIPYGPLRIRHLLAFASAWSSRE